MKERDVEHVARMEEARSAYSTLVIKPAVQGGDRFRRLVSVGVAGVKCVVREKGFEEVD
jgi:hypothetical protein